jgi:hypothetical protein
MKRWTLLVLLLLVIRCSATDDESGPSTPLYPLDEILRINHLQAIGTHNSYHQAPEAAKYGGEWDYTMAPLDVQLSDHGVRQFELDVYEFEGQALAVLHIPVLDNQTTCRLFSECLQTIKDWSDTHPHHHPVMIMIEPKTPIGGDGESMVSLDDAILDIFPIEQIITPDEVRGNAATLRLAVAEHGWPTLAEGRGRVIFSLCGKTHIYLENYPMAKERLIFPMVSAGNDHAAVIKINDPVNDEEAIRAAVEAGLIVRTRADAGNYEAMAGDTTRLEAALRSGAHFVSTDFPAPVSGKDYFAEIPGGLPSGCNPVTAPDECTSADIEDLGL